MRNKIRFGIFGLALVGILGSCQTSNDVVSNRSIQKRKYNDGYYISFNKKNRQRAKESEKTNEIPADDQIAEVIDQTIIPQDQKSNPDTRNYIDHIEIDEAGGLAEFNEIYPEEEVGSEEDRSFKSAFARSADKFLPRSITGTIDMIKKKKSNIKNDHSDSPIPGDAEVILLVILAIILPPLAVFIYEGASGRFWLDFVLWIIGWALFGWLYYGGRGSIGGLCSLIAVIYALLIVLGVI